MTNELTNCLVVLCLLVLCPSLVSGTPTASPDDRINVAAAANGGNAIASSTKSDETYPASSVINGDRKGMGWGAGGGWSDDTPGEFPDSIEIEFADVISVDEVDVFTLQDAWWNPSEPTESMLFFNNGITAFRVEYFDGENWNVVPGATVTNNNLVWRKFTFAPVIAEKIRIVVTDSRSVNSTIVEVEAYGVPATPPPDPSPSPTPVPPPAGNVDIAAALALHNIFFDEDNNIGFGTTNPVFNDDGTTGAFVGNWVAIDGRLPGAAAYLGLGGTIHNPGDRIGALNFYNLAMGGADNRTAAIMSFNGPKLGTGNLEFYTSPNFIGPVRRMQIAPTGEVGINHPAGVGTTLQIMSKTADSSTKGLVIVDGADHQLLTVRSDGQVSVDKAGQGIVLKSPDGQTCRKLTIDNSGNLVLTPMVGCP